MILFEERAWGGSGGIASGLFSHTIGAPPIAAVGSEAMKARVLPQILSGEKISALAITEPGAGSDVAHLTTTRAARAITTSSTAPSSTSPPACAPTFSRWRCARVVPARAASRCC